MAFDTNPENILFLDIETVPLVKDYNDLEENHAKLWDIKFEQFKKRNPERYEESVDSKAAFNMEGGIFAEFGKIVCISVGVLNISNEKTAFRIKSFTNHNEENLLLEFSAMISKWATPIRRLCGHNIKEFDIPYICRRMIINNIPLPEVLNVAGKKPWEIQFLDTLELWKFGDYKHYTSLNLLTTILNIPSPKDDIDGSMVGKVYYIENDLKRISSYCEKDVFATAQVFFRLTGKSLLDPNMIEIVN